MTEKEMLELFLLTYYHNKIQIVAGQFSLSVPDVSLPYDINKIDTRIKELEQKFLEPYVIGNTPKGD